MPASVLDRIPGAYQLYAAAAAFRGRVELEVGGRACTASCWRDRAPHGLERPVLAI